MIAPSIIVLFEESLSAILSLFIVQRMHYVEEETLANSTNYHVILKKNMGYSISINVCLYFSRNIFSFLTKLRRYVFEICPTCCARTT